MKSRRAMPVVCSVGSTDPTAGAGLFADAGAYARLGAAAAYVVAGVTAQNSAGVKAVRPMPASTISAQLRAVWRQVRPGAVRIGLVPAAPAIFAVVRFLKSLCRRTPIVVDPVIAATSGHRFAGAAEVRALRALLSIATIATPNASEAAELSGMPVRTVDEAERAAVAIARSTGCAILVTGGHVRAGSRVVDVLVRGGRVTRFSAPRIEREVRGTGCLLAAALAASLARGDSLDKAVVHARSFVRRAIATAQPLGRGVPQFSNSRS